MMVMPGSSKATIQGTPDAEITPEQVMAIGETIGMQYGNVVVGRNMHPSSRMILSSLIAGLTSAGASVRDAGTLPTPVIPYASKNQDCCVMIGNPDDRDRISGLSFLNNDGRFFNSPQMYTMTNRLRGEKRLANYDRVGTVKKFNGAIDQYTEKVASFIGSADCQIIVDCAGDSASSIVPAMMNEIGADSMTVDSQTDVRQHGTWANPEGWNVRGLAKIVKANYGSIGVAMNSDGTRIAAVDEEGNYVSGETLLQLFVKYLQPKRIAVPIDTTIGVKELMKGTVLMTPIGSEQVGEAVKVNGLEMGGCEDGSFVFKDISYATDGITAAAMLAKIATESLSDMIADLPQYYRAESSVLFTDNREIIARRLSSKINDLDYDNLYITDGWRVETDSGWFLIRFNDESTSIDIKVESTDKIYTAGLMEIAKEVVMSSFKSSI